MRIEIKNFGPISNFEFDLSKDLNIIFGKNNIGKSYSISLVYLILKNLLGESSSGRRGSDVFLYSRNLFLYGGAQGADSTSKDIESIIKKLKNEFKDIGSNEVDITKDVKRILIKLITNSFVISLDKSLQNSFASIESLNNKISNKPFSITLHYKKLSFTIKADSNNKLAIDELRFTDEIIAKKAVRNRKPINSDNKHILYFKEKDIEAYQLLNFIFATYYHSFKDEIVSSINNVYFLPASRSGLYQALSTFSAVIAELSKSRTFVTQKIELPTISEPVSDYFLFLSRIQDKRVNKKYSSIVQQIEKDILKGEVLFDKDSGKIVFSQKNIQTQLDLSFTSSMISEIAPIVAYLKYIISNGDSVNSRKSSTLIFIEEPEAHLHPEIQVKLMELFIAIAHLDIKVVMTSHSNYMLNKLSNMLLDKKISNDKVGSYLMRMTDIGSTMDTLSMKADEDGIVDENFVDIAEELYNERIDIYDKLNSENAD